LDREATGALLQAGVRSWLRGQFVGRMPSRPGISFSRSFTLSRRYQRNARSWEGRHMLGQGEKKAWRARSHEVDVVIDFGPVFRLARAVGLAEGGGERKRLQASAGHHQHFGGGPNWGRKLLGLHLMPRGRTNTDQSHDQTPLQRTVGRTTDSSAQAVVEWVRRRLVFICVGGSFLCPVEELGA